MGIRQLVGQRGSSDAGSDTGRISASTPPTYAVAPNSSRQRCQRCQSTRIGERAMARIGGDAMAGHQRIEVVARMLRIEFFATALRCTARSSGIRPQTGKFSLRKP